MGACGTWRWRGMRWGAFTALALTGWSVTDAMPSTTLAGNPGQEIRIEISIRDFKYVRTKMQPVRTGVPVLFVIHNEDSVRHGFISPLFSSRPVRGEGEGIEAFGSGIEGFHLDPGKTLMIRLTPDEQGKVTFHCDLHSDLEGELYLMDVPVG